MRPLLLRAAVASIVLFGSIQDVSSQSHILKKQHRAELLSQVRKTGSMPVIVQFKAPTGSVGKSSNSRELAYLQHRIIEDAGATGRVRNFRHLPFVSMEITENGLRRLLDDERVESIQQDEPYEPLLTETAISVGAEAAWSYGGSGAGQTVVVIDTGVDVTHEFLADKIIHEACFASNYSSSSNSFTSVSTCPEEAEEAVGPGAAMNCDASISGCDHGTRVAGIVAGQSDEMSGIARDANLVAIQVFSRFENYCGDKPCVRSWVSDQVAALDYVYGVHDSLNIAAVNLSLGGGHFTTQENCDEVNPAMRSIIDMLHDEGVAVIAASGNSGLADGLVAPACLSNAISVGATTKQDDVSSFSSSADFLDLLAPGQGVVTSVPGGGYSAATGTSFSAPHVAGAWAILRAGNPDVSIEELLNALRSTGHQITDERNGVVTPRIQVDAALQQTRLPVELVSFTAFVGESFTELTWETASETNNAGFEVEHSVGEAFEMLAFVGGGGTRHEPADYSYMVRNLAPGWHYFRLRQIDFDGFITYSPQIEIFIDLPGAFHMGAAYPNPFNPSTQFTITIARRQKVRVDVFDLLGKWVATLEDDVLEADQVHQYTLDGSRLASGIYLIQATGESFRTTRSVTLLK